MEHVGVDDGLVWGEFGRHATEPSWYATATRWDESTHEEVEGRSPDPGRLSPWLAATILVAYCAIFWIGLVTVAQWLLGGLIA